MFETYAFPVSHEEVGAEEILLRPILIFWHLDDWASIVVVSVYVLALCLVVVTLGAWFINHQHVLIRTLQKLDSHKEVKYKGGQTVVRGSAIGGILTLLSYALALLGLLYFSYFYFKEHNTLTMNESAAVKFHYDDGDGLTNIEREELSAHDQESAAEAQLLERNVGIPDNVFRQIRFMSYQEESYPAFTIVQRMRHYVDYLFTLELFGVNTLEGHVWGATEVYMDGCTSSGGECLQLIEATNHKIVFILRRPYELTPPVSIRYAFADDFFFTAARLKIEARNCTAKLCPLHRTSLSKTLHLSGKMDQIVSGVSIFLS